MDEVFKYDCNLNIGSFIHMLDDPTECYKFYWLDSIMQLLAEKEESITFDKVISGMIADAWYSVTEYHLKMGTRDTRGNSVNSIERAVNKLNEMNCFEYTVDRRQILEKIKENEKLLHDEKYQIAKNVPCHIEQNEYEIDHFVPWSFVTNDEMWNLIPVNPSLNASKRDKLPNWDRYFLSFAQNQFRLNQMVYKYERLAHIFRECQRDSLNAAWSVEELYVKNIKNDQFCKVLESRLKPIYELARTQGYRIWMVGE